MKMKILGIAFVAILALAVLGIYSYQSSTSATTGTFMRGCLYDTNGNVLGCNNSVSLVGQSITGVSGVAIGKAAIPSAYVKINYTGLIQTPASSWAYAATERVDYQKGVSQSFPIQTGGRGNPPKTFNVTLPQSSWTTSQLISQWGSSYGSKVMNVTLVGQVISLNFVSGLKISKPSANNFVVQFQLNYGAPITTTSSSTSTTISSSSSSSSSSSTTTSTSTTISGGGVTTGTKDAWLTTITSASGGATGNAGPNGIIATLAPDIYFPSSQSVVWVYYPATVYSQCSQGIFVVMVTPTTSVTVGRLSVYSNTPIGGISFAVAVTSGSPYLLQVLCADSASTMLFNQVVTAAPAQTSNLPPIQFPATATTTTTTLADICAYYTQNYPNSNPPGSCPGHVGAADRLSIISVTF